MTREAAGRRINVMAAESSLLLRKPLGEVPHEGGLRLLRNSKSYEYLRDWMREGAKDDPGAPAAVKLEILPGPRVLNAPAKTQQVAVVARYADGSSRDVTPICYYNSSSPEIADVDADGFITFKNRGEVAVIAHYLDLVANVRLTHLVEVPGFRVAEVPSDNTIDRAVFAKLNRMRIKPSDPAPTPSSSAAPRSTPWASSLARGGPGVPGRPGPRPSRQAGRPAPGPDRVRRLLDLEVRPTSSGPTAA